MAGMLGLDLSRDPEKQRNSIISYAWKQEKSNLCWLDNNEVKNVSYFQFTLKCPGALEAGVLVLWFDGFDRSRFDQHFRLLCCCRCVHHRLIWQSLTETAIQRSFIEHRFHANLFQEISEIHRLTYYASVLSDSSDWWSSVSSEPLGPFSTQVKWT